MLYLCPSIKAFKSLINRRESTLRHNQVGSSINFFKRLHFSRAKLRVNAYTNLFFKITCTTWCTEPICPPRWRIPAWAPAWPQTRPSWLWSPASSKSTPRPTCRRRGPCRSGPALSGEGTPGPGDGLPYARSGRLQRPTTRPVWKKQKMESDTTLKSLLQFGFNLELHALLHTKVRPKRQINFSQLFTNQWWTFGVMSCLGNTLVHTKFYQVWLVNSSEKWICRLGQIFAVQDRQQYLIFGSDGSGNQILSGP